MWLKSLKLRDVCQHAQLDLEFGPGIVGIVGQNGVGKTNLVALAMASLTNDFSFKGRTRDQQIRRGSPEQKPSYVLATWVHGGTEFTVERSLRPNRNRLWIGPQAGKPTCGQARDVQQALTGILGVDPNLLTEYIYAPQWGIFSFLSDKPAARKDSLARLCGCEKADRLWNVLGEQIAEDQDLAGEKDRTPELEAELETWLRESETASGRLESAKRILLPGEEVTKLERCRDAAASLAACRDRLAREQAKTDKLTRDVATGGKRLQAAEQLQARANSELLEAAKLAKQAAEQRATADEIARTNSRIAVLRRELAKSSPAVPDPPRESEAELLSALAVVQSELSALEKQLEKLDQLGGQNCPTCGCELDVHQISSLREESQTRQQLLREQLRELTPRRQTAARLEKERAAAIAAVEKLKATQAAQQRELATLKEQPEPDVAELDRLILAGSTAQTRINELTRSQAFLKSDLRTAEKLLTANAGEIANLRREETTLLADLGDVEPEQAANRLSQHYRASGLLESAKIEVQSAAENVARLRRELANAVRLRQRTATARVWLRDLNLFRSVFHRDAMPREFMRVALAELAELTNERLNRFDVPFQMLVGDDADIQVRNADGSIEPAHAKSGGEMVTLAIAYRLACGERFVHDIGCMALDEPTAGLDQHRLGCLESVLQRIGEVTRQSGQQIILITHDQRLERVFNHLIRLG